MKIFGRLIYALILPVFRLKLRKTRRAYVVVSCGGQVLLSKNWLGRQKWQLPGGGIKASEQPPAAAARELYEETGVSADAAKLQKIHEGIWQTDRLGFGYEIYRLEADARQPLKIRRPEIAEATWLDPKKLNASNTAAEVLAAIRAATGELV